MLNDIERGIGASFIKLKGSPYQRTVENLGVREIIDCSRTLDSLVEDTNYVERVYKLVAETEEYLGPLLNETGYYALDKKIKHGEDLSFADSFSLMAFVCSSLNTNLYRALAPRIQAIGPYDSHIKQSVALLSAMSAKEAYVGLTSEEIAGMVAATVHLDTVVRVHNTQEIISFGGMGGDKGYPMNGNNSKLFSLSTLASTALSVDSPVHKHHSYPNTSKISGQSAIEALGGRSDFHTIEAFQQILRLTNLLMTSCHDTRTLHTLSHELRGETINHLIGPLAFTMSAESRLNAFIGVNEKIHPETIINALQILDSKGFQRYGNSVVFCGTDLRAVGKSMLDEMNYSSNRDAKSHIVLDEVAPPPFASIAAFLKNGTNVGSFVIYPEDFYPQDVLSQIDFKDLLIPNEEEKILFNNRQALTAQDVNKARYLAMTMGLALFTKHYLERNDSLSIVDRRVNPYYLRICTQYAFEILTTGKALEKLEEYVRVTNNYAGSSPLALRRVAT